MPTALVGALALPVLFVAFGLAWWGKSAYTCHHCPDRRADGACEGCPLKGVSRRKSSR